MRGKMDHSRERTLRRQQTQAELLIWQCVRNRRLHDFKFRRQHRIGPYFVDFVCLEAGLVVELDGSQHLEPGQQQSDLRRTGYLQQLGYRVIRFWDDEALRDTDKVLDEISRVLQAAPHPAFGHPLPAGGGGGTHKVCACFLDRRLELIGDIKQAWC